MALLLLLRLPSKLGASAPWTASKPPAKLQQRGSRPPSLRMPRRVQLPTPALHEVLHRRPRQRRLWAEH